MSGFLGLRPKPSVCTSCTSVEISETKRVLHRSNSVFNGGTCRIQKLPMHVLEKKEVANALGAQENVDSREGKRVCQRSLAQEDTEHGERKDVHKGESQAGDLQENGQATGQSQFTAQSRGSMARHCLGKDLSAVADQKSTSAAHVSAAR